MEYKSIKLVTNMNTGKFSNSKCIANKASDLDSIATNIFRNMQKKDKCAFIDENMSKVKEVVIKGRKKKLPKTEVKRAEILQNLASKSK
jgi:hypothetical protein